MKFFAFITLFSVLMLICAKPFTQVHKVAKINPPPFLTNQHREFTESFKAPQNANIAWAFISGQKLGISSKVQKDFRDLEISFLFSPSGIHLSALMLMFFFFVKKIASKKQKKWIQCFFLILAYFIPFLAIKRIVILRLLIMAKQFSRIRLSIELLFLLTFALSFILGHYQESPSGFILSFFFIGTFIGLKDRSRIHIILGLLSTHLILCYFSGAEFSLFSLLINIPLIAIFSFLMPFLYIYLISFRLVGFNWIELTIRGFIILIHWSAKLIQGTFMSSTLFLILAVWIILLKKQKRYLVILLLLHSNLANSPAFFTQGHLL